MAGAPPAWIGFTFVPKLHSHVPDHLAPQNQCLPNPFVVCIVGGSRGIGAGTATAFAQAGASRIVITGATGSQALLQIKTECEAIAKSPVFKASIVAANFTEKDSGQRVADTILAEHGRLDVLVNNAGIVSTDASAFSELGKVGVDQLRQTMEVNYLGKFLMVQNLLPILLESNGAKTIINVTSAKQHFASHGAVGYNISTLALHRLTEAISETYAEQGVLACAVRPGIVRTEPAPIGQPPDQRSWSVDDPGLCGAFLIWLVANKPMWLNGRYLSANWDPESLAELKEEIVANDKLKMRMVV